MSINPGSQFNKLEFHILKIFLEVLFTFSVQFSYFATLHRYRGELCNLF